MKILTIFVLISSFLMSACEQKEDIVLSDSSLGQESLPGYNDCFQLFYKGSPVQGTFVKKIAGTDGANLEVVECQNSTVKIDPITWKWVQ